MEPSRRRHWTSYVASSLSPAVVTFVRRERYPGPDARASGQVGRPISAFWHRGSDSSARVHSLERELTVCRFGWRHHGNEVIIAENLRPQGVHAVQHHVGQRLRIRRHGLLQRIDVIAKIVAGRHRRIVTHVDGEPGNGDVLDPAGPNNLIQTGSAQSRTWEAWCQQEA